MSTWFPKLTSGKLQIRRFQPPYSGVTTVIRETFSNIYRNNSHCQKLESFTYISAANSMSLYYFLRNYSWKVNAPESETAGTKTEFDMK